MGRKRHIYTRNPYVLYSMGMETQHSGTSAGSVPFDISGMEKRIRQNPMDSNSIGHQMDIWGPREEKAPREVSSINSSISASDMVKGRSKVAKDMAAVDILGIEMRLFDIHMDIESLSLEIYGPEIKAAAKRESEQEVVPDQRIPLSGGVAAKSEDSSSLSTRIHQEAPEPSAEVRQEQMKILGETKSKIASAASVKGRDSAPRLAVDTDKQEDFVPEEYRTPPVPMEEAFPEDDFEDKEEFPDIEEEFDPNETPIEDPDTDLDEAINSIQGIRYIGKTSRTIALERRLQEIDPTIHILGTGRLGKFIAHSLAKGPHARPITLLMHRPVLMQTWHDEGAGIRSFNNGRLDTQTGFHLESAAPFHRSSNEQRFVGFGPNLEHTSEPPRKPIDTLIVTTSAQITLQALWRIKHRLHRETTICFIQDGLGVLDEVNKYLFPDPDTRPNYMLGNMSHKFRSTAYRFTFIESRQGILRCTKLPQKTPPFDPFSVEQAEAGNAISTWSPVTRYLTRTLASTPEFHIKTLGPQTFHKAQLRRLIVGSVIGPISTMFDCTNDQLLHNHAASRLMFNLINEISQIAYALPELTGRPDVIEDFSVRKLKAIISSIIRKTGKNYSGMRQAVKDGRRTRIDYFNGYLSRKAHELGIPCPMNDMLIDLVKGKQQAVSKEKNMYIPFAPR